MTARRGTGSQSHPTGPGRAIVFWNVSISIVAGGTVSLMSASGWRMLTPLVLATMASQSLLVVLGPTIVAIGSELHSPVSTIGQARSVTAVVSVAASVVMSTRGDALSLRRQLAAGSVLAVLGSAAVAVSTSTPVFLLSHALVGVALALLVSGGFAGVAAFAPDRRGWATGYVAAAQGGAWVVVNPAAAGLTESVTWRAAHAVPAAIALAALLTSRVTSPVPPTAGAGRRAPLRVPSARRWVSAEAAGFAAWTAVLTFAGAFFIEHTGAQVSTTGWILAAGALAYLAASTRSGWLAARVSRRRLVAGAALVMAALMPVMLTAGLPTAGAAAVFCLLGFVGGIRTPASAGLGLAQLPGQPTAMMAARTAATQSGYLLGAVIGGAVIAGSGYPLLGFVLALVMSFSAWLVLRVTEPTRTA